jgi:hypothetical protein
LPKVSFGLLKVGAVSGLTAHCGVLNGV